MTLWRMGWRWRLVRRRRANWWKPSLRMFSSSSSERQLCKRWCYSCCFSGTTSWTTPCCLAFTTLRCGVHIFVRGVRFRKSRHRAPFNEDAWKWRLWSGGWGRGQGDWGRLGRGGWGVRQWRLRGRNDSTRCLFMMFSYDGSNFNVEDHHQY